MLIDRTDLAMLVYNTAVVLSGGYLAINFGIDSQIRMLPVALGVGLLWTVYYHVGMASLLEDIREGTLVPDDEERGERDTASNAEQSEESEESDEGIDPPWA